MPERGGRQVGVERRKRMRGKPTLRRGTQRVAGLIEGRYRKGEDSFGEGQATWGMDDLDDQSSGKDRCKMNLSLAFIEKKVETHGG